MSGPLRTTAALVETAPTLLRVSGPGARAALGRLLPCDLRLRSGSLRSTMILDSDGSVLADAVLAADEEDWLLWVEGLPAAAVAERLRVPGVEVQDLADDWATLAVEGPFAWDVLSRFDEPGVLAMPFLSFYRHPDDLLVWRWGRTGEFGYQLIAPRDALEGVRARLMEAGQPAGLAVADEAAWRAAHREAWSFDVHTPGLAGLDPRELGLRWRIWSRSEAEGLAALAGRPITRRLCAVVSEAPLPAGGAIHFDGREVGVLRWSEPFAHGPGAIGGASLELDLAFAHLSGFACEGRALRTVTPPFIVPRSMWVRPDTHDPSQRDALPLCAPTPEPGQPLEVRLPGAA